MTASKMTTPAKNAASPRPPRKRTRTKVIPEDRVEKVGNPGLLTKALADRLIGVISTGVPLDVAIAYVGVHRDTLRKWRRRGDKALELSAGTRSPTDRRYAEFVQRLDTAMAETTVLAVAGLRQLMTPPRDGTPPSDTDKRIRADLIKFYLSRRDRKHYGATIQAEVTGPNGGPILSADLTGEEAWEAFTQMFGDPSDNDE